MADLRRLRTATPEDAAAMLSIYAPVVLESAGNFEFVPPTEAEFAQRIERVAATDPWLVLERNEEIAGYAYASAFRSRPAYATTRETTVYVHPDHHRAGVGRQLMTALLDQLAAEGTHVAIAIIGMPNEASVRLHESLGFRHVGTLRAIARKFDAWQDESLWELRLDER